MQKKIVSFEILYSAILVKNCLRYNYKNGSEAIYDFFAQKNFFLKKTFIKASNLLGLEESLHSFSKREKWEKLEKILDMFIAQYSEPIEDKNICLENLNEFLEYLNNAEDNFRNHLKTLTSLLIKHIQEHDMDFVSTNLYYYLWEFKEMFKGAKQVVYNSELIENQFKTYFDILNLSPQNVIFLSNEENIKIIQDLVPDETVTECFYVLGLERELVNYDEFFVLEMYQEYYQSEKHYPLLAHELGHLLDINVFNFNGTLANNLYNEYSGTLNMPILQRWLNELIADTVAYQTSGEKYIECLSDYEECGYNENYPPIWLRRSFLNPAYKGRDFNSYPQDYINITNALISHSESIKSFIKFC